MLRYGKLKASGPQNEDIFSSQPYAEAEDVILAIVRELLTSADYDHLVPALLLSRHPCRRFVEIIKLNLMFILSFIAGKPEHYQQPALFSLILADIPCDDWRTHMHVVILAALMGNPGVGDAYCLTAERFMDASILWIMKLADSRIFWDPRRNLSFPHTLYKPIMMINESQRRLKGPFRWRLTTRATRPLRREGRKHFVRTLFPIIGKTQQSEISTASEIRFSEFYRRRMFSFILSRIPSLLEKASRSDVLAALRFRSLAPLIACFPKQTKRARLAMDAYAEKHGYRV